MGLSYSSSTRGIEEELVAGLPSRSVGWKSPKPGPGDVIDVAQFLLPPGGNRRVDRGGATDNTDAENKETQTQCQGVNNAPYLFNSDHLLGENNKVDWASFLNHYGVPIRDTTSRIILRIRNLSNAEDEYYDDGGWVTFDYSFKRHPFEEIFEFHGPEELLYGLLPPGAIWEYNHGIFDQRANTDVFLTHLPYMLNNLDGELLWNNYKIALNPNPRTRLELIDFELEDMKLIFKLTSLRKVEIMRSQKRFKLIGTGLRGKENQILQFWGNRILDIELIVPKDGTLTLKFPPSHPIKNF